MKNIRYSFLIATGILFLSHSCNTSTQQKIPKTTEELFQVEKSFCDTARVKGIAYAFFMFADENAVILRENDSLIRGREAILNYYRNPRYDSIRLEWAPEFADISSDGTLAYTYGNYTLSKPGNSGIIEGRFHTVWKRQKDGSWKFVWD